MSKYFKHLKVVLKHKWIVFRECCACGFFWRGLIHDNSKLLPTEFFSSAKYFQGDKSPIDAEKAKKGYSEAWLHHKGHNKHHWEWWTDFGPDGEIIANKIPSRYVIEMICDWIGAGMVYGGENWTQGEPLRYYYKVRPGRHFHPETETLIIYLLEIIRDKGLDAFHKICRDRYHLLTDYDELFIP